MSQRNCATTADSVMISAESVGNGVLDGRDETAWVDVEVPLGSWGFEVDDDFFVVEL